MNSNHDLEVIIRSRVPIVAVESSEEQHVQNLVVQVARKRQQTVFRWSVTEGLHSFDPAFEPSQLVERPIDVLGYIKCQGKDAIFLLLDYHHYLKDPVHIRLLKDIALAYPRLGCTVVLLSHAIELPDELKSFSGHFSLPLPTVEELRQVVCEVAGEWGAEHHQQSVQTTNKAMELLVRNLMGLTTTDARRLARNAIRDDGAITLSDIPGVMKAKYDLLRRDSVITFEYDTARFSDIGGLKRLKGWLEQRKSVFLAEPGLTALDPPKGILLLGVQGCGKSLAAKAAAGVLGVPLLRLDFGTLYNKYYGETERNLRDALNTASLMAPCVVWMDEIEKGLATTDSDDGVSLRILGTLLTWMAERKSRVFLVATANEIQRLPPELLRKGRFDEIFFVDLPNLEIRQEILKIHLKKRRLVGLLFQVEALAQACEGFSGAEIEQAIVSALYTTQGTGQELKAEGLLNEFRTTRPLAVLMAEPIQALRAWAATRTVSCD